MLLDMDSPTMVVVAEADGVVADAGVVEDERSLLEVVDKVLKLVRPAHIPWRGVVLLDQKMVCLVSCCPARVSASRSHEPYLGDFVSDW